MRRFAVIDIPLPSRDAYAELFETWIAAVDLDSEERERLVGAALELAFGPRQLGPAILLDIARFVSTGTTRTQAGPALFSDAVDAFVTAVRLYVVPQYEGADRTDIDAALQGLQAVWPDRSSETWAQLDDALAAVAL